MDNEDYRKIKIDQLLTKEKNKTLYEYDFGDGWRHEILQSTDDIPINIYNMPDDKNQERSN